MPGLVGRWVSFLGFGYVDRWVSAVSLFLTVLLFTEARNNVAGLRSLAIEQGDFIPENYGIHHGWNHDFRDDAFDDDLFF